MKQTLHAIVGTGAESAEGVHYLQSRDRGATWSPPHRVGSSSARRADIASTTDGRVLIAWDQMEGSTRAIYVMQSHSGGIQWFKPERISNARVDAVYPRAVDVAGGFLVAWTENEKGRAAALKMQRLAN